MRSSQQNRNWSPAPEAAEETYRDLGLFWFSYRPGAAKESETLFALKVWAVMSGVGVAAMSLLLAVVR